MEDFLKRIEGGEKVELGDYVNDDTKETLNITLTLANNDVESVAYLVAISRFYGDKQRQALEILNDYLAAGRLTPGKCRTLYLDHKAKAKCTIEALEAQLMNDLMEPLRRIFVPSISPMERHTTRIRGGRMAGAQIAQQE